MHVCLGRKDIVLSWRTQVEEVHTEVINTRHTRGVQCSVDTICPDEAISQIIGMDVDEWMR